MNTTESTVTFTADADGVRLMGVFIAQLVKEGVTFKVENFVEKYFVTLTGGF